MRRVFVFFILISLLPVLTFSQVKGGDIYGQKEDNRPIDMATFYAQASVQLLANQLNPGQTLGSAGRDSKDFNFHFRWARDVKAERVNDKALGRAHVFKLRNELVEKFKEMVRIKENMGKEALANWYAIVCTTWASYRVDFGSDEANSTNHGIHKKRAKNF